MTAAAFPSAADGERSTSSDRDLLLAAYNQNFETFRALNGLMWQIPLIAMTLTGGLWFGVAKVDGLTSFRLGMLALATLGDLGLVVVLQRLRFIIGEYLAWLQSAYPSGHVAAVGRGWFDRANTVKAVFQLMLLSAATISLLLMVATVRR